ncbi:restriction endonuclease subunit S [Flavobacteriaceae bacterium GSB9]|nr:restriction endonuclease subunit S [Flavobacteriaceae bacterium GSB9]
MNELSRTFEEGVEVKEGFKMTKIGFIPNDWEVFNLGDLGELLNGLTYSPKDINENGTLVLRSSNVQNRQLEFEDNVYVDVEEGKYNPVKENDILICVRNGSRSLIGKNALINKESEGYAFGAFMAVYRSPLNKFLFQLFDTDIYNREVHRNLGATINSINGKDFKRFLMPMPPEKERAKIAFILSDWDEAIENTQTLVEKLELRKKGLMQQLLTGKTRLAGFTDKWRKVSIGEIATQFTDKNKKDENIEVLSCTKYDGLVRSLDYFGRKVFGDDLSKYKIVPRDYFAYATNHIEEGSIGYQDLMERGLVSPMYTVFKTDNTINDSFMYRLLKTDRMIYNYQSNMSGSIARRGGLRWNVFETIDVSIPPLQEQNAIAVFFDKIDEEIMQTENYLMQLQEQKKGLMQQLLTGQIRVKLN